MSETTNTSAINYLLQLLPFRVLLIIILLLKPSPYFSTGGFDKLLFFSNPFSIQWHFDTPSAINLSPTASNGNIYLPLSSGQMLSISVVNGQLKWMTEIGGYISASPISDERGVYVATQTDTDGHDSPTIRFSGAIRALSQNTGITLWVRQLRYPMQGGLTSSGKAIFGGTTDGRVFAINKITGEILWITLHTAAFASLPVVNNGRLYIGSEDGTLLVLNEYNGHVLYRYRTQGGIRGPVAVFRDFIYFGSADGYVYAFNVKEGRLLWRRRTGARVQAVVYANNSIIVTSLDNFVYMLSARRGELQWKRQLAGRISALPLIDKQSALFAPLGGDACVVLSLRDGKQLNTLPVGEEGNTLASPLIADDLLLISTRRGLVAFKSALPPNNH